MSAGPPPKEGSRRWKIEDALARTLGQLIREDREITCRDILQAQFHLWELTSEAHLSGRLAKFLDRPGKKPD